MWIPKGGANEVCLRCGTCGVYQDARPEQDTQIREAVEVQRTWRAVIVYVTYPTPEE